ncbi:MAG: ankyrin repeat domain-containing protein [Oscillatoria sp. PMC 1051.18]|nr:ankyrin repeat domain-containing protein [Oscillatoria sp. PMC 1050.18]MEC5031454.1 ankyrin repeat domain-containing protein [Oscillatoria sp. PMC 1051.18]
MDEQLFAAIAAQDLPRVEELLAAGANPNARQGDKSAYQLVPHGSDEIKCALIEAGAEDPELIYSLVWVIGTGRVEAVRVLINKGADVNVSTGLGTPIRVAAGDGMTEIVELLIEAGADVDAGSTISTPLMKAIAHGHTEIVRKLLAAGADLNLTPPFHPTPAIGIASAQGSPEIIQSLISAGVDVNTKIPEITLNSIEIKQQAASSLKAAFEAMEAFGQMMQSLEGFEENEELPNAIVAEIESELAQMRTISERQQQQDKLEPDRAFDTFPAILAARCGHAAALAILLAAGADPHRKDGAGMSAFDWALRNEYPHVLAVLRQFGVTETRYTLEEKLLLAAENGDLAMVRDCLDRGAEVNARDTRRRTKGKTALILAAMTGHLPIVQVLLAAGADPQMTDRTPDDEPLPESLWEDMGVETILKMGYIFGRTALMEAAKAGHTEIVQSLLEAGANPNYQDEANYTALALAAENNHFAIVQALVAAGADVNLAEISGNTPLLLACEKGAVEIGEFLLRENADFTQINSCGRTALMNAAEVGSLRLVELLLARGVDVNAVSKDGETAIAIAAAASHYVEVDKSAPSGGMREYRDDGCWELQPLPEDQILAVVQALLQAGANPNLPDPGTTPLIEAARHGQLRLLQVLLDSGASLAVRDRYGNTAVYWATKKVLAFLREYTGTDLSEFEEASETEADEDPEEEARRWGADLPQPDFSAAAQNPCYQEAVNELAEICGSKPTGSENFPGWYEIHVQTKRRQDIDTEAIQRQFLTKGYFVYEPQYCFGDGPEKLCILPTTDKYDAIALHQTYGCNYGIGPGYVVEWLKNLEAEQPFIITCIRHDLLAGRFLTPIQDPEGLAASMYDFCPDLVDQGCGSVEQLAESLVESDRLYFWWD